MIKCILFPFIWFLRMPSTVVLKLFVRVAAILAAINATLMVLEFWSKNYAILIDKTTMVGMAAHKTTDKTYFIDLVRGDVHYAGKISKKNAEDGVQDSTDDSVPDERSDDNG